MGLNWPHLAEEWLRATLRDPRQHFTPRRTRVCPCCDYAGPFIAIRERTEARCPNCGARERDRIIALYLKQTGLPRPDMRILHFAPEAALYRSWRGRPNYVAADIAPTRTSETRLDITAIAFPDESFDLLICNHVFEHVPDDQRAMAECARVLRRDGLAILSVPLDQTAEKTFVPPPDMSRAERERICGPGHLRLYGMDFEDKLRAAGFAVGRIAFSAEDNETHRLAGEIINICRRAPQA